MVDRKNNKQARKPEEMRLQKFLSLAGVASRRHAEELIAQGRVKISGRVVKEMGVLVVPGKSRVEVDNKPVFYTPERNYILFHKPTECVTTLDDPEGRTTVIDLLPKGLPRVFPVGRLDWDTEGLLLLTNDGELAYRLMHPGSNVPRVYHAKVRGELKDTSPEFKKIQKGVELEDGFAKPDRVAVIDFTGNNTWVEIELHIGRNRIVRRMFEAIGYPVMKLRRVSFGNLTLDGLPLGSFRDLSEKEVETLYSQLGEDDLEVPAIRSHEGLHFATGFRPGERMPRQAAPSRDEIEEKRRLSGRIDRRPRPGRNASDEENSKDARRPRRPRPEDRRYESDESRSFNASWDRNDRSENFDRRDDRNNDRRDFGRRDDRNNDRRDFGRRDDRNNDRRDFGRRDDRNNDRRDFGRRDDRNNDRRDFGRRDDRNNDRRANSGARDERGPKKFGGAKKRQNDQKGPRKPGRFGSR